MKAARGNIGISRFVLNLGSTWRWVVASRPDCFIFWKRLPVPIELEAVWTLQPVWTFCRKISCIFCG